MFPPADRIQRKGGAAYMPILQALKRRVLRNAKVLDAASPGPKTKADSFERVSNGGK